MNAILLDHAKRYPDWQTEDLYKLIHQAAMGSEHAIKDLDSVGKWLEREISNLRQGPVEPLIDPISPDGRIVRVHLRPLIARNIDQESLLQAFIRTANEFVGSTDRLLEYADVAVKIAESEQFRFSPDDIRSIFYEMQQKGFPALHHSDRFENEYHPAYRVILKDLLPDQIFNVP